MFLSSPERPYDDDMRESCVLRLELLCMKRLAGLWS
jgi:hypothetical protein